MQILESWEDQIGQCYAIVRYSDAYRRRYQLKPFAAMFLYNDDLWGFGGGPGFRDAEFDSIEEAHTFLLAGIEHQQENPEVWLEMAWMGS